LPPFHASDLSPAILAMTVVRTKVSHVDQYG
jgi:hypothetical protein